MKDDRGFSLLPLVLVVSVIAVGAGFLILQNKRGAPIDDYLGGVPPSHQYQTSDFRTYIDTQYGFEIQYPSIRPNIYYVSALDEGGVSIAHGKWKDELVHHPYIAVKGIETDLSIDEWVEHKINSLINSGYNVMGGEQCMHCVSKTAEEVIVGGGIRGLRYKVWAVSGGSEYTVIEHDALPSWLIEFDNHIAGSRDPGETRIPQDVLDQIFSTFRFVSPQPINP